ncbi:Rrf2 family transcriptional regulator [Elizabethkingia sp. JS20170427COW]|uniref:RrF2 family transcriptional regulator n=1 Tax=Elizabethkingia sp. JS20170427COW TaxID=2583851 RepID=UPI00111023AE|nr:Rrf2 family transcriptional regulator [Elizabethkingia sp. JS20170427COW]QCX52382.1 Rrf2 family transcriptional regulator [Elizabethkingia sp. JS20170427COW]
MFSKTCEYAIRALVLIAQKTQDGGRIGIKDIATDIDSPEYFIAKILQNLSRKGFVQSVKGPNGGFYLDDANLDISLAEVVKEIDGDKIFTGCALGLKECSETHPCPLHKNFKYIRSDLKILLETSKIRNLVNDLDSKLAFLKA